MRTRAIPWRQVPPGSTIASLAFNPLKAMMQKDIRLARHAADELATPLPSAAVADWMLTNARELGYAHRDLAALHEVLARTAPATLPTLPRLTA